ASGHLNAVNQQSGLFAGKDGYHISADSVDLQGGAIGSTAAKEHNQLTTNSLTFKDIENHSSFKASNVSLSGGFSGKDSTIPGNPSYNPTLPQHESGSDHSTTHATISPGQITINGKQTSVEELGIHSDIDSAHSNVSQLPDLQQIMDRQQAVADATATIANSVRTLSADMARKANQERQQAREKAEQELQTNNPELWQDYNGRGEAEKQKILRDISKDYRTADEQAQSWGIGGGKSRALNAVTSAVTGILGGQTNLQAATNALAPYAAELIGKQFGHGDNQNQAAQLVAHALLGAISASINGGNAAAGAVGASAAELAAQYLIKQLPKDQYPEAIDPRTGEIDPNRLPESVKASIRDLSSAVATVSGGLTGGSLVNAQITGVVGQNAAENNELQQRSGFDRNYNYIEEDIKRIDRIKSRVCNGGMSSEACTQAVLTDIKKGNDQSLKQLIDGLTFIPAIGYVDSGNILINGQSLSGDEVNRLWGVLGFVSFGYGQKLNTAGKILGKIWRAIKPGEDLVTSTGHVIKNAEANAIKSESRGVGKEAGKEAANAVKGANGNIAKQETIVKNNSWVALDDASKTAFGASKNSIDTWIPKDKHMVGTAATRSAQFNTNNVSEIRSIVREALDSPNANFLPNNIDGSFRVVVDLGRPIGTKGQTSIRVIIGNDGKIWNAFPVNSR
ncbi:VENN motif pre-toxin domain-containing protein, partial [Snodgrassella sp. ESL0253]|uniref:VENN motif pre-toxin domain-containing protein n=1 Tax=Snodgrassella sp. ESL0253 TaxID=2705031 RepID=UPI001581BB2A